MRWTGHATAEALTVQIRPQPNLPSSDCGKGRSKSRGNIAPSRELGPLNSEQEIIGLLKGVSATEEAIRNGLLCAMMSAAGLVLYAVWPITSIVGQV